MTASGPLGHPSSFVLWGPDRGILDRVALAIARSIDPEFYWFDVTAPDGALSRGEREVLEEVPVHRAFRLSPPEVELQNAIGNVAVWAVLRHGGAEAQQVSELADFVRLPDVVQRTVSERNPDTPGTLVVSNADHASHLYPADAGTFSPYIRLLNNRGLTLILTTGMTPRANAADFEVILKLQPGAVGSWSMKCEKGSLEADFAPFGPASETSVDSVIARLESRVGER